MKILLYIYCILLLLFGIAFFINGIIVFKKEGRNFFHILPSFFGISFMMISVLIYLYMHTFINVKFIKFLILLISYVPFLLISILLYSNIYCLFKRKGNVDFIIILGCKIRKNGTVMPHLRARLDIAISKYKSLKKKPLFVVCGAKGNDEPISEALAMKNYLIENGIDKDSIILEDKSTNTIENINNAKKIMDKLKNNYKCIVATSKYHLIRTLEICNNLGLDVFGIGSKTTLYYYPTALSREIVAYSYTHIPIVIFYIIFSFVISFLI